MVAEAAGLEQGQNALQLIGGQIETLLAHHLNHQGVEALGGLHPGAFHLKLTAELFSQVGLGNLAAAAVMLADEQDGDFLSHWSLFVLVAIKYSSMDSWPLYG